MNVSKLEVYSLGTVAANKALDSKVIEVVPIEVHPMTDGAITDNLTSYDAQGVDSSGQAYQESVGQTPSIMATWLPMGLSNRKTAPDVRRGEQVILYRFANQDKYWWASLMDDMSLRKLETVIWAFSGTEDEASATDADTSYYFEVSTHTKMMHVHTSTANGEPYAYDVQINAADGVVIIQDDIGNQFLLDSKNSVVRLKNDQGAYAEVNKMDMNFFVPETFTVMAKRGQMMFTEELAIETQLTNIESAVTNHKGDFNETGAFGLNGDMVTSPGQGGGTPGTGKIRIAGATELLGDMDVKGAVSAVTIAATEEITAPNLKYN